MRDIDQAIDELEGQSQSGSTQRPNIDEAIDALESGQQQSVSQPSMQTGSFGQTLYKTPSEQESPVSFTTRLAMGFADETGKQELLQKKFKIVQKMPNGDFLVGNNPKTLQEVDPDGFFNDALGELADISSELLPIAGQFIGTIIGAGTGVATGGVSSVPGAIAGAGIGAASGEAVKSFIGRMFGLRKEEITNDLIDIAVSGTAGAIGEGIFTGSGKLLSNGIKSSLDKGIKTSTNPSKTIQTLAKIFKITSGTNPDDIIVAGTYGFNNSLKEQYMNPEYSRTLMTKFVKGVDLRNKALGSMVQRGDDWAIKNFGKEIVDTDIAGKKLLEGLSNPRVGLVDDLGSLNRGQFTEASDRKAVQNFMQTFFKQKQSGEFVPRKLTVKEVIDLKKKSKPFLNKYFKSQGKNPLAERSIAQYLDELTQLTQKSTLPKGIIITDDILKQNPYVKANRAFSQWKKDIDLLKENGLDVTDINDIKNLIRDGKVVSQKIENFFERFNVKNSSAQQAFSMISQQLPVKFAGGGVNGTVGTLSDELLKYNAAQGFRGANPNALRMSAIAGMVGINLGRKDPKSALTTGGIGLLLGTPAGARVLLKGGESVLKNRLRNIPKKTVSQKSKNILKAIISQNTKRKIKQ